MSFIIVDPGLVRRIGHHYNFDLALKQELERRNIPLRLYAHRNAEPLIMQELGATPVFTDNPYIGVSSDPYPLCQMLEDFVIKGQQFHADLIGALPAAGLERSDIVLFHTVTPANLLGILTWLGTISLARRPLVVIGFQIAVKADFQTTAPSAYRMCMKALRQRYPRLTFFSCSAELAQLYGEIGSVEVATLAYPVAPSAAKAKVMDDGDRTRLKVVYLGHSKQRRGVALLPGIVTESARRGLALDFVLQLSAPWDKDVAAATADPAMQGENVRLITTSMSEPDYFACLNDADIVLLPYDSNFYRNAHSGVFTEAVWLGKVTVCPGETWMARQLAKHEGGGVCFDAFTAAVITDALEQVVLEWPRQRDRARRAASQWQEQNNSARFVEGLLEFATRQVKAPGSGQESLAK